ncbi:MAG: rhodanese-like domain-containing protein [Verrucomicrobia bacterium]|nr:rhodanese-like domain-containing protein [Verrucomicrobiota bacterium]MBV8377668.1 rhodanese-like domain-containing protein [Verrucomicrobiota bacterium]
MTAVRQALLILLAALIPASLTAAFHPRRPAWSQEALAPGEETLPTILNWGDNLFWVDARSAEDYAAEHVPGAILLNLEDWDRLFPKFLDRWSPGQRVVVYCSASTCELSRDVAERLRKNGISPVFVLKGGWEAWKSKR